ncbi:MAG: DUF742 domain-containing protein [Pseudonocardiaceae bacterium]|nr:DUF742 domain-containing protein [Pseudonocardiaceae bacterium]
MSTDSGFPGEGPGTGGSPRRSGEGRPPDQPARDTDEDVSFADVLNSLTLDSGRGRRRRRKDKKDKKNKDQDVPPESPPPPEEVAGTFAESDEPAWPDQPPEPAWPERSPEPAWPDGSQEADEADELELDGLYYGEGEAAIVRPYAWTGGRTKANYALELETLVSSTERAFADIGQLQVEHRSMVDICRQPRSVAEVAALLGVPLGVVRVLISDVADMGLVNVHQNVSDDGAEARLTLMERVLSGLRRL